MSFLTPAFLLGLVAIGIPVVLHLRRRHTQKVIAFPSLMFIERIPDRSLRRRRLRDLLLLAARCAVIALIAVAFARPLTSSVVQAIPGDPDSELVILVDRSYSMAYGDRFARAIAAVRERLATLGRNDLASVVAFDETAEALGSPSADAGLLGRQLDDLGVGDRATRYAPALRLARSILLDSERPARRVVMVSDFQRAGMSSDDAVRLPAGIELELVDVGDGPSANLALTEAWLDRQQDQSRERLRASTRVAYRGDLPIVATAELEVNGRVIETKTVDLEPDGAQTVRFEPVTLESGLLTRGVMRVRGDQLLPDNERRFTVSPADDLPVLIVDGPRGRRARSSLYLERALATSRRPPVRLTERTTADLRAADFSAAAAVILNDSVHLLGPELRERAVSYVREGGGLLLVLGVEHDGRAVIEPLGLRGTEAVNDQRVARHLALLDYGHPVFEPFAGARSGDFSGAEFFRYRPLSAGSESRVVARFDNGDPALVERDLGKGRVLLWGSTLDVQWGDLVLQPVFVPWIDRAIRHLAGYQPPSDSYAVGQVAELALSESERGVEWVAQPPAGDRLALAGEGRLLVPLDQAGFWEVRPVEREGRRTVLAVNVDTAEGDLARVDLEEARLQWTAGGPSETATESAERSAADPGRQKLWWLVLLTGLLALAAESLLSNRRPGGAPGRATEV